MKNNFRFILAFGVFLLQVLGFFIDVGDSSYNIAIAPILGAALVGAGANLVGGAVNNIVNRSNMGYQVDKAKELMQYQWDKFQSYPAQVESMTKAGLNPAALLGQGGSGLASGPSVNMPTSQPIDMGLGSNSLVNAIQTLALAKKTGLESEAQNLQNEITYRQFDSLVHKVALENSWTEGQTIKTSHEINKILGEIAINANMNELEKKKVDWFERHMKAEISELMGSAEYQKAMAGLTDSNKKLLDDTMNDLKSITGYNKEYLQKLVQLLDKYGDAQAIIGMVSQVVSSASDFIGNFIPSKKVVEMIKK